MGKLFLYSDQISESPENQRLDSLLFNGMETEKIKVGYIPSTQDKDKKYFRTKVDYYQNYGISDIVFFDLYAEFTSNNINKLMECDIIHLSAGNPIEFRKAIKHRKMEQVLWNYYHSGGIIVGVSGGAVQLGQSTALFHLFKGSDCVESSDALKMVNFEFLPHYNRWNNDFKQEVLAYSKRTGTRILCVNDGDGVIVDGKNIQMIGDIKVIGGKVKS
ncbi:Type 1 glutamine amidotransferase-like domain-containing protein [Bacillus sp. es.036]|uniref:Type 1 glutamine amidotransferase-like domain-containing protein n=1 Tax=Bacillus sp. es.036 TaxID=1761764 RepID=UPI000C011912|nr:Type 1 glutamine amidotransferase-like domain-containing protein [Bacillus sp. es.036]PFG13223.1 dipeptidase E [Bacillus sp. es.036]